MSLIRTQSVFFKNKGSYSSPVFNFLTNHSKNVYNHTLFCHKIYFKYKNFIYKEIINKINSNTILNKEDIDTTIYRLYDKWYKFHIENIDLFAENNKIIFKIIIETLKDIYLVNDNFLQYKNIIINSVNTKIETIKNEYFEKTFFIESIMESIYTKNFNTTKLNIKNKVPIIKPDERFIKQVKRNKSIINKKIDYKKQILEINKFKDIKLLSDDNIIARFIYRNLG